jgi:hypothetical protein
VGDSIESTVTDIQQGIKMQIFTQRHKRGWEDNIKMGLNKIWWVGVDWIHVPEDRDQ